MRSILFSALFYLCCLSINGQNIIKEFLIDKQYLNFPVSMRQGRQMVKFVSGKDTLTCSVIRIADSEPD